MKAASSFMSAVSAVALSAGLVFTGSAVINLAHVSVAQAQAISSIDVRGNQRIEADTIRGNLGIEPGSNVTSQDVDDAVRRLFGTGLFSDVRITRSGATLIVNVEEYAIVNQVLFEGNRQIRDEQLRNTVQMGTRAGFSQAMLDADVEAIRRAYARIGRNDAQIGVNTVDLGDNRVNVVYTINEGDRTRIASIDFIGNEAFRDGRLRDLMSTRQSNFLSFLTRNDIFDEDRLRADEEVLRRFYYNRGYADFRIVNAEAHLDEAANQYTVTITVDEGERYRFGDIEIDSTVAGLDEQRLASLVETESGRWYSAEDVEASIIALTENVAGQGYAFAEVTPRGSRSFEERTISVLYTIDEGPRTYIDRIEIRGNTRTRDYVIRREFDLSEGDAFNQVLIQRAKRRLERLDFFESVNISTAPGSEPDQVVVIVDLVEKSTGELSIGGGYTTSGSTAQSGFSVEGSIAERNFLGRGQSIRISAAGGRHSRDYRFSFTEPYFLGRRMSAGFDIYRQTRDYRNYGSEATGGSVRLGLPITENLSTQIAYNYEQERYHFRGDCHDWPDASGCGISNILADAIENQSPWVTSSVSGSITYNSIDNMQLPREGIFANVTAEFAGLGGDARFVKVTGRGSYYQPLVEDLDLIGVLSVGGGHVSSTGGGGLRIFDHFQSTDQIIRGFAYNGIGPHDINSFDRDGEYDHLGGTTYFNASAEMQFPIPLIPESIGIRGAVFADAATLYGNNLSAFGADVRGTDMEWRASVGAGLLWNSPFGPLRVDYAVPVVKEDSDIVQNFSFGVSTRF